ncbi:MAG: hypothetical protein OEQ74_05390 [Gammaproteobacteria bacterium]|nr:hypothetical protein [Gammaproteobacteria bacterium]
METVIFVIALLAVMYVLIWAIRNDDAEDDEPTQGLFQMKHHDEPAPEKTEDE